MDDDRAKEAEVAIETFRGFEEKVKALPNDVREDLRQITARAEATGATAGETKTAVEDHIDTLPAHVQQQLRNGIVDLDGLTPEHIRGLAMDAAIDGEVASLAFALRGDTSASMNNWKAVTADGKPVEVSEAGTVSPPDTPQVPDEELAAKKKPPLVGV